MRVSETVQRQITEYARWHDVPRWMTWVEMKSTRADGSQLWSGAPAAWLPWNMPRRPKRVNN